MRLLFNLVLLILAGAPPALAQAPEPPSRVGQIGYVSGDVAFRAAGDTQWSAAGVNYPVAAGGSFWTDPQARAQIQIGPTTIGMAGGTELDVTNLNDQVSQFSLPQGRINLHLRQLDNGQSFEIDLPQGAVWLLQPGSYDIDAATADQPARVAVFAGSAHFVGGGADIGVSRGDAAVLTGANPVVARIEHASPDAFVEWCAAQDYHAAGLAAARYVSPQMTGYADLDHYGGWQGNPQYGEVWYPSQVPADWAPYRDGRWIWVQPWGWTWVDQQPWGFAPFHYGRWAYVDDRWGWIPGSYVAQPVYAPALVAFVGGVTGIGLAVGGGPAVGWFPLAPGETYWPSYTRNAYYIRNINVANVRNINTVIVQSNATPPRQVAAANFANRRFATIVPQRVFASADPVAPAAIHIPPAALAKASVALRPPQINPAAVAVRGPQNPRPVSIGSGTPPPTHPASTASGLPGMQPHPPGTPPERAVEPGRPGAPSGMAAISPHPGAATTPEWAENTPAAGPHTPAVATTATLPPPRPGGPAPAMREAQPKAVAPAHLPAAVTARQEERPMAAPERRPPPISEPRPAATPHPQPPAPVVHPPAQAQIVHRPTPAAIVRPPSAAVRPPTPVARPAPAAAHPPAPAPAPPVARPAPAASHPPPPAPALPVARPAPTAAHPPAPAPAPPVARPAPAAAHPPPPAPVHAGPHPANAAAAAHGGGKPVPKEDGKKSDDRR